MKTCRDLGSEDSGQEGWPPKPIVYHSKARDVAAAVLLLLAVAFLALMLFLLVE